MSRSTQCTSFLGLSSNSMGNWSTDALRITYDVSVIEDPYPYRSDV
ncbi:MAG: hypothetical protein VX846_03415 [Actinomycetota bacterium]|nr:hypothetical protein [Actinomycetota bacterium]